jgi:high-affinity iron transporter
LREGLEAGFIVMAIVAFLNGSGRRREIRLVWAGVAAALAVSVAAGVALALTAARLSGHDEEVFEAIACAVAVLFITTMIFWMRHSAAEVRRELEGKVSNALRAGPLAIVTVAFVAVVREGLEAAIFVLVLADGGSAARSVAGLLAGVAAAVVITWVLHAGLVRVDMAKFLTVTSVLLVIIGAGILAHLVTSLQHLNLLPGGGTIAYDASGILPLDSWWAHFIDGMIGISARPTVFAFVAWLAYVIGVLVIFRFALMLPAAREQREPAPADA